MTSDAPFETIEDLPPESRVLARLDLNSPVSDGVVQDNRRFDRHAETVEDLCELGHAVVVLAHQGRPGDPDFVSLQQHASILDQHVDAPVEFIEDHFGREALSAIETLESGSVLVLENVRMLEAELAERTPAEHAESEFVQTLAEATDGYVGDAYSAAHRAHASIVGFPLAMEVAVAGRVMADEYLANSAIQSRTFDGPVRMVLGGTKADDLIGVMHAVDDRVDEFLLGGVIGELFLRANGHDVGFDVDDPELFDPLWEDHADEIESALATYQDRLWLPTDLAYQTERGGRGEVAVEGLEKDRAYLDIGTETIETYRRQLADSDAVFVKGALGVFEDEQFKKGTVEVLRAIGETDAFSVVGGGDTSRAFELYDLDSDAFDHVSIAGGAYVRALTGDPLPGVEVLRRSTGETP